MGLGYGANLFIKGQGYVNVINVINMDMLSDFANPKQSMDDVPRPHIRRTAARSEGRNDISVLCVAAHMYYG